MRPTGAEYMEWAKQVPRNVRYSLAQSGVRDLPREELGFDPAALEFNGAGNEYGSEELRAALAARHGRTAPECLLAEGTSMVNVLVMGALVEPGDRILVETPGYEPLHRLVEFFGGQLVLIPRRFEDGFQPDEGILNYELKRGARAVFLTNLHNPSGALLGQPVLERIYAATEKAGAHLVVDEVYREYVVDLPSASSLGPRAIITTSTTKVMGLSGLRMGWAVGDSAVLDRGRRLHGLLSAQTSWPSVCVARAAVPHFDRLAGRARRIAAEGQLELERWLPLHPEIKVVRPAGGLVSFPRLPDGVDGQELVSLLLKEFETVAVPGFYFQSPGHIRLAVGAPLPDLREGLNRLGQALERMTSQKRMG